MRALILFVAVLASTAGCLRKTEFKCQSAAECGATGAMCEQTGFCSFVDSTCTVEGRRYGDFSGQYTGLCVGEVPGIDGGLIDGRPIDSAPGNCPTTYAALGGVATHRYRRITNTANWTTQVAACSADGANAYLAVPSNMAELQALVTLGNVATIWVGISDSTEGTYATTNAGTFSATDPMWDAGEPDDNPIGGGGGAGDCVAAIMSNAQLADDACNVQYPAVCECEP